MSVCLRDDKRYGRFKANSNMGEVIIDISICGWGEQIEIEKNKKIICSIKTLECYIDSEEDDDYYNFNVDPKAYYEEDNTKLCISEFDNYGTIIEVKKPFLRTLKRYK